MSFTNNDKNKYDNVTMFDFCVNTPTIKISSFCVNSNNSLCDDFLGDDLLCEHFVTIFVDSVSITELMDAKEIVELLEKNNITIPSHFNKVIGVDWKNI